MDTALKEFTLGRAGTGKSVLLREIISSLKKKYARFDDAIQVTASTGIAACNIGGVTLHSFGGIGLGMQETPVLCSIIRKNKKALGRWLRTKVLVIDESEWGNVKVMSARRVDRHNPYSLNGGWRSI